MVIGILRIIGLFEKEAFKVYYPVLVLPKQEEDAVTIRIAIRALCELLSFSFILLILDVIADFIRMSHYERHQ